MNDEPNRIWSGIVDFLTEDERQLTDDEVVAELAHRGIPATRVLDRVLLAVQLQRARARLESARQARPALVEQLRQTSLSLAEDLHETIRLLIERQSSGPLQAAYFRRLEGAASKSDLHQLLADLQQLDQWNESDPGATDANPY